MHSLLSYAGFSQAKPPATPKHTPPIVPRVYDTSQNIFSNQLNLLFSLRCILIAHHTLHSLLAVSAVYGPAQPGSAII